MNLSRLSFSLYLYQIHSLTICVICVAEKKSVRMLFSNASIAWSWKKEGKNGIVKHIDVIQYLRMEFVHNSLNLTICLTRCFFLRLCHFFFVALNVSFISCSGSFNFFPIFQTNSTCSTMTIWNRSSIIKTQTENWHGKITKTTIKYK